MPSLGQGLSYLIAAQFQALGLILVAWWGGGWLNEHHALEIDWYAITFPIATVAVAHSFYVVVRHALNQSKESRTKLGKAHAEKEGI